MDICQVCGCSYDTKNDIAKKRLPKWVAVITVININGTCGLFNQEHFANVGTAFGSYAVNVHTRWYI
jgi:hypothetical protein